MTTKITQASFQDAMRQQLDGNHASNSGWTDLLGASSSARVLDGKALTTRAHDYGTAVDFAGDSFGTARIFYATVQTDHRMALNQAIEEHMHFTLDTAPTETDRIVRFQVYVACAGVWGAWELMTLPNGGIVDLDLYTMNNQDSENLAQPVPVDTHWLGEITVVPAGNTTVSSMYKIRIERITTDVTNNYGGNFLMDYFDGHILIDQERGSREEYVK